MGGEGAKDAALSVVDAGATATGLDPPPAGFAVDTLLPGALAWLGGLAGLAFDGDGADQLGKALQGIGPVLLPGAELLGLDDDHPVGGDALVAEGEQSLAVDLRQGGSADIKAQMHGGGHLVDVLAPGPLGADGGQLDVVVGDGEGWGDLHLKGSDV